MLERDYGRNDPCCHKNQEEEDRAQWHKDDSQKKTLNTQIHKRLRETNMAVCCLFHNRKDMGLESVAFAVA